MARPRSTAFPWVMNRPNSVYLCELSDGTVKVGFSNKPRRRILGLAAVLANSGVQILRASVFTGSNDSDGCLRDISGNEKAAISALNKVATPVSGHREYFRGITYEAALERVSRALRKTSSQQKQEA